jgi:hypothetical protein
LRRWPMTACFHDAGAHKEAALAEPVVAHPGALFRK